MTCKHLMLAVTALAMFTSCLPRSQSSIKAGAEPPSYENSRWFKNAAESLWRDQSAEMTEAIRVALSKGREDAAMLMLEDPRFSNTLFDFFMYFSGNKKNQNRKPSANSLFGESNRFAAIDINEQLLRDHPNVTHAAHNTFNGRDFSVLFNYQSPVPLLVQQGAKAAEKLTAEEVERQFAKIDKVIEKIITLSRKANTEDFCKALGYDAVAEKGTLIISSDSEEGGDTVGESIFGMTPLQKELEKSLNQPTIQRVIALDSSSNTSDIVEIARRYCPIFPEDNFSNSNEQSDTGSNNLAAKEKNNENQQSDYNPKAIKEIVTELKLYQKDLAQQRQEQRQNYAYSPTNVSSLKFNNSAGFPGNAWQKFWQDRPNSSTNYNRGRAEYILKQYFCDDMTPLNIIEKKSDIANHVKNKHASDPSCRACHYKLDPMAGFFKDFGRFGQEARENEITFDDNKTISGQEFIKYQNNWKSSSAKRRWDIGYIKYNNEANENFYGEKLADLLGYLKRSKEVRSCITKRLGQYFVGRDQAFDGKWLNSIASDIYQAPARESGKAIKKFIAKLVTSKTFIQRDRKTDQCYDFAGGTEENKDFCPIAHIIEKHCLSCHSKGSAEGGLDLSTWVNLGNGPGNFSHRRKGKQLSRAVTFALIQERINSPNDELRMPQSGEIPAPSREALFHWLREKK